MSGKRFDAFVLFAEMRTGSNHLEESLNTLKDVTSYGEIFNPVFLGKHNQDELFGITMAMREDDPFPLLSKMVENTKGLPGFRFFHDHDPRVVDAILDDPKIGKVILTRNPLDSYVSLKIAAATGQWRLTNPKMAKSAKARFNGAEFDAMIDQQCAFRDRVQRKLQVTGQTGFWISYDQISDLDVLNGLAAFLGSADQLSDVPGKLKKQNPGDVEDKVENPDDMHRHLAGLDPFLLNRSVNMEPPRGPSVPTMLAAPDAGLLFMPIAGGPVDTITDWMARMDGQPPQDGFSQKDLKRWMRQSKGFVTFAVVRHPLERAFAAWQQMLAETGPKGNETRRILANQHGVEMPVGNDIAAHSAGFLSFLRFLRVNLGGGSALKVAPNWASQTEILAGQAQVLLLQHLIREPEIEAGLHQLADQIGRPRQTYDATADQASDGPTLADIFTDDHDDAAVDAYRRDFMQFGFKRWKNT